MWFKISQVKVALDFDESQWPSFLEKRLALALHSIQSVEILRKSLDARHKEPSFVYTLVFQVDEKALVPETFLKLDPNLSGYQPSDTDPPTKRAAQHQSRPVIVGSGPAGLFAGLKLAAAGFKPLIIERGDSLVDRVKQVNHFWQEGQLDPQSNIQYGLGGAGTFSDGKLTTRIKDTGIEEVLKVMVKLGAPADILYWQYPHIGTDLLREVVSKLQDLITEYGGEIRFRSQLTDLKLSNNQIETITINGEIEVGADVLLLATGNSGRELYTLLDQKGFALEAKPFAVGLRIEHPQEMIDKAQYGKWSGHTKLGPAEYHLTYKHPSSGRGVYSFCMCPGGFVVGAASETGGVVTNGMSYRARNSGVANSAVVVTVHQADFSSSSALAGIDWQRRLEQLAFQAGGNNYAAPVQRWEDFRKHQPSEHFSKLAPSYQPGVKGADLWQVLPSGICEAIGEGIKHFGTLLKGFDWPDAVLTGVETRTSAPVRIIRDDARLAKGMLGIYPVGEGAGYAGGIISSALDGWKTAGVIIEKYGV